MYVDLHINKTTRQKTQYRKLLPHNNTSSETERQLTLVGCVVDRGLVGQLVEVNVRAGSLSMYWCYAIL